MVFDGTIKDNLLYALDDDHNNDVLNIRMHEAVIRSSCEFIYDFPK
jgi:ABC-type multidrug transport system fused ATPase/permease subunit